MVKKFVAAAFVTGALLTVSAGVASAAPTGNPPHNSHNCTGVLVTSVYPNTGPFISSLAPVNDGATSLANCGVNGS
jgi:hypothetical protein